MLTANWAVQPSSWSNFDPHGCTWATDINHAYRLFSAWSEDVTVWIIPHNGNPYRWTTKLYIEGQKDISN